DEGHFGVTLSCDLGRDGDLPLGGAGGDLERLDVGGRDALEPDRLPDAGAGRVPDAVGITDLLAAWLKAFVGGIPHPNNDFVFAIAQCLSDVEAEGIVASSVLPDLFAVYLDLGLPVDGAEVKKDAALALGRLERAAVPKD